MNQQQLYDACVAIAPNFRLEVRFGILGRTMVWIGTPRGALTPLSAGLDFPDTLPFEQNYTFLLNQALITLTQATA